MIGALTLDQLRVLIAIEETGSFSAAGRQLRRVQSAISHAVQGLEESQGVQLFDRSARIPRFTEAGKVLVAQARQVLRQAEVFELTARSIASGLEPELSIALDSFVPTPSVIRSLARLQATHPDLAVTLYTEGIGSVERRVRDGSATLGVCALFPAGAQDLQTSRLTEVDMLPVVAPSHPLAREKRPLTRDILAEHVQLILTDAHQKTGPSYAVVSSRLWRFVDISCRLEFLLAGFGWGTMPDHLVAPHIASGNLVRLPIDDPGVFPGAISLYAIYNRKRPLGMGAQWLLNELAQQDWFSKA